jgi:hypothetical protein
LYEDVAKRRLQIHALRKKLKHQTEANTNLQNHIAELESQLSRFTIGSGGTTHFTSYPSRSNSVYDRHRTGSSLSGRSRRSTTALSEDEYRSMTSGDESEEVVTDTDQLTTTGYQSSESKSDRKSIGESSAGVEDMNDEEWELYWYVKT